MDRLMKMHEVLLHHFKMPVLAHLEHGRGSSLAELRYEARLQTPALKIRVGQTATSIHLTLNPERHRELIDFFRQVDLGEFTPDAGSKPKLTIRLRLNTREIAKRLGMKMGLRGVGLKTQRKILEGVLSKLDVAPDVLDTGNIIRKPKPE